MNGSKAILFDVDGVLIKPPHYFSKELQEGGYKSAEGSLNLFYHGEDSRKCSEGKADAQTCIMPYLEKFGWAGSAKDYFEQQFDFEKRYLDKDLISLVTRLRNKGIKCYLSTDQMANRAEYLLNEMEFKNIFDGHFISCYIGYRKCHENFWSRVIADLEKEFFGLRRDEIIFVDDIQNNIDVASGFGIRALLYGGIGQLKKEIRLSDEKQQIYN